MIKEWIISFLVAVSLMLCTFLHMIEKVKVGYINEIENYEKLINDQEEYVHELLDKDAQMRIFRHDNRALWMYLHELLEENDRDQVIEYINEYALKFDSVTIERYSGVSAIDAVVCDILNRSGIDKKVIKWEGSLAENKTIKVVDLCVVISNMLSNAVEACEKQSADERFIDVCISHVDTVVCIRMRNPAPPDTDTGMFTTSKSDKRNHGLGIASIKKIASKYGGDLRLRVCDGIFESVFTA